MGLFRKKKEKEPEVLKLQLNLNRDTRMAEFKCPYCYEVVKTCIPQRTDEEKPTDNVCPFCKRVFLL